MPEINGSDCRSRFGGAEVEKALGSECHPRSGGTQKCHDGPAREKVRRGFFMRTQGHANGSGRMARLMTISAGAALTLAAIVIGVTSFTTGSSLQSAAAELELGSAAGPSASETPGRPRARLAHSLQSTDVIQRRIDQASEGSVLEIPPGVYEGRIDFKGKRLVVISRDGPSTTIIDAKRTAGPAVVMRDISSKGAAARLEGFTIRGSRTTGGSGVLIERADPIVARCIIEGHADGGVRMVNSRGLVDECRIISNAGAAYGAGAQVVGGSPVFVATEFIGNSAVTAGGAIFVRQGEPMVLACRFADNNSTSGAWGGAIFSDGSDLIVCDSEFERNRSSEQGGAIYVRGGSARIERCAFEANASPTAWSVVGHGSTMQIRSTRFCGSPSWNIRADRLEQSGNEFDGACPRDCNGNGIPDDLEIRQGQVTDCDGSGVPDPCKLDCDGDGIPDACAIAMGVVPDLDGDGLIDDCDRLARERADRRGLGESGSWRPVGR